MDGNQPEEEKNGNEKDVYKLFQDLVLDLNLDQATADEAWRNYEELKLRYFMEGCQMFWVACSVYFSCWQRRLPTVGGRPGSTVQGNCISLTRLLRFCNLTMVEFIRKMRLWLKMTHLDSDCVKFVDTLERKFAVSNNIYGKYRLIFLDLFVDPDNDAPRPVRSRKQRKPPCNATELYQFCWTLYILVKARYPGITQDLVMSYFLLLSCVDLIYVNVKCMSRTDLLSPSCEGYPKQEDQSAIDTAKLPDSIMDYLCRKFEGVVVETKVVRDYYWKPDIRKLVETKLLKGSPNGLCLLECQHFDHNVKEVRNAYEANLLTSGEFDDRMFLTNDKVLGLPDSYSSSVVPTAPVTPMPHLPKRGMMLPGDYHLMPQTPLSGPQQGLDSPGPQRQCSPLAAAAMALRRLDSLVRGRTLAPSAALTSALARASPDPMPVIQELLTEMGTRFCKLYCEGAQEGDASPAPLSKSCSQPEPQNTEEAPTRTGGRPLERCSSAGSVKTASQYGPALAFAKTRLKTAQILFFTFLESIIQDETKRGSDINAIVKQALFFRTLFVCSVELMLKCYDDHRRFPWSLQVGEVPAYLLVRIIEPVVRSEQQCDNRLSRELVKHLKRIEEQILDLLAWQSCSPLWAILENDKRGVPSCKDVNFSHLLDTADNKTSSKSLNATTVVNGNATANGDSQSLPQSSAGATSVIMSPAGNRAASLNKPYNSPRQSPLSSAANERLGLQSPPAGSKGSVKRTLLFPPDTAPQKAPAISAPTSASTIVVRAPLVDTTATQHPQPTVTLRLQPDPVKQVEEESSGEPPRRNGSLALFFRKVYNVANLRLGDLCNRLQIDIDLRRKIWTCLEYSIIQHTHLLKDRHLDQLIMCAIYIVCKVTGNDRIFQDIMKQYRCQPQADSHIYRSVLIRRISDTPEESEENSDNASRGNCLPPTGLTPVCDSNAYSARSSKRTDLLPWKINGTSSSFKTEERGDLIKFYNHVYVQEIKTFALKFKPSNQDSLASHLPPLSPVPMVRVTPVSPRRRISSNGRVFVHSLSPATSAAAASPRRPFPYYFNSSPNKNLRAINSLVHLRANNGGSNNNNNSGSSSSTPYKRLLPPAEDTPNKRFMGGISRRLSTVLDDRQRSSDSGLSESISLPLSGDGGSLGITNGGEIDSQPAVEHDENTPVGLRTTQQVRRC